MADFQYAIINGNLTVSGGDVTSNGLILIEADTELKSIAKQIGMEIEDTGSNEEV